MSETFKNTTITVKRIDDGYEIIGEGGQLAQHSTHVPIDTVTIGGADVDVNDKVTFSRSGMIQVEITEEQDEITAEIQP